MAAQDLQIQPRRSGSLSQQSTRSQASSLAAMGSHEEGPSLLSLALKRRWWLFLLIGCASAALAREAMEYFGKDSSRSMASLIHTGLPNAPEGGEVIKPLAPATCSEIIKSFSLLGTLCESRGLEVSPKVLQEMIETKATRGSSLLSVEFAWSEPEECVSMLNELLDTFVEEIASQRKRILRNHMRHVENSLLESRAEVADARQQIFDVQAENQKVLDEGGLNSERYRSILSSVSNTQLGVDEKRVEQLGVMQQIEVIQRKKDGLKLQVEEVLQEYKSQLVRELAKRLKRSREKITTSSPIYQVWSDLIARVKGFAVSKDSPQATQQWQVDLYAMLSESEVPLPLEELTTVFDTQLEAFGLQLKQIETERQLLAKQEEQLELDVIPLKNQIKMFEDRLVEYQKQADDIGEQLTGVGADQFGAFELRLEQAENQQKALSAQLDNMRQLEKCRVREWTVSVPASLETTEVSSNRAKLFALAFGLCGLVLSVPVLVSEWSRQQDSPQVAFANSLQLPVMAERLLQDFSPSLRSRPTPTKLTEEQLEVVRMLALRIQQSSHCDGAVILFSSIDSSYNPAPLMASVAECLSQREEKVLIIDAICPVKSRLPLTNVLSVVEATEQEADSDVSGPKLTNNRPGLSEYLTSGNVALSDMIRQTDCPGVDLISSGHSPFPREGLASSHLTELVEQCRENYTMILVNSPAATASADLQMLTARADGVVLMATKNVHNNPRAHAAVTDLIELGAPIIGVVA